MTVSVAGIPTKNFQSNPQNTVSKPVSLCRPNTLPPRVILFKIDWSVYGANVGILINLIGLGPSQQLDMIKGIAIDNAGCANNVSAIFTDTNYTVPCAAYTVSSQRVLTNQLNLVVYNLTLNASGITTVYLTNTDTVSDIVAPQSPIAGIQGAITGPGTSTDYFVTGDSTADLTTNLTVAQTSTIIPSQANGFFVLTEIEVSIFNCTMRQFSSTLWDAYLLSGATVVDIYAALVTSNIFDPAYSGRIISSRAGLQLRLPATSNISFQNLVALETGSVHIAIEFTWSGL
jgi:hypothetical protein